MRITGFPGMWEVFFSTSVFSGREFSYLGGKVKLVDSWIRIKIYLKFVFKFASLPGESPNKECFGQTCLYGELFVWHLLRATEMTFFLPHLV